MSPRVRKLLWGLLVLALTIGGFLLYRKYVLHAAGPSLSWKRE